MQTITLNDLAREMAEQADFPIDEKTAKAFAKKALVQTTDIMKNSRGKIMFRACDLLQVYKSIDYEELKAKAKDLNEVAEQRNELWPYKV